jgi:hypothetical protein
MRHMARAQNFAQIVVQKHRSNGPPKAYQIKRGIMWVKHTGKHLADQDTVKKVAGGAAIGAAAGIIAPIGLATGALIGAGIVAYRHVNKKKNQEK